METCVMFEWETPKDDKRWKDYWDHSKVSLVYFEKKKNEGVIKDYQFWSDNTGHVIFLMFFEDENNFAKAWGDMEFQKIASESNRYFDNARIRLMRPATTS